MAMTNDRAEQALKVIGSHERAIPGQSLTSDPDARRPFEQPPTYTTLREANHAIFNSLIEEDTFRSVVRSLGAGVPVGDITSSILYSGFTEGQWNPDLMLALVEPTMYMVMAMGERVGIDDMRLYAGEDDDIQDDEDYENRLSEAADISNFVKPNIQIANIPENITEKLANMDVESLLRKTEAAIPVEQEQGQEQQEESLLAATNAG